MAIKSRKGTRITFLCCKTLVFLMSGEVMVVVMVAGTLTVVVAVVVVVDEALRRNIEGRQGARGRETFMNWSSLFMLGR